LVSARIPDADKIWPEPMLARSSAPRLVCQYREQNLFAAIHQRLIQPIFNERGRWLPKCLRLLALPRDRTPVSALRGNSPKCAWGKASLTASHGNLLPCILGPAPGGFRPIALAFRGSLTNLNFPAGFSVLAPKVRISVAPAIYPVSVAIVRRRQRSKRCGRPGRGLGDVHRCGAGASLAANTASSPATAHKTNLAI
jgi:hypothetical protein